MKIRDDSCGSRDQYFEVVNKRSQLLRIELDGRLCAALDAVVTEIVLKCFS